MTYPYIPAKHHGVVRGNPTLIVIHSMEAPEKGTTAEAVARYFQSGTRVASAHFCIDQDSIVQCVPDNVVAYAAPGSNRVGVHLEFAGYARQTREEWLDLYGKEMLTLGIKLAADLCRKYQIPPLFLTAANLKAGNMTGVTTHAEVTKAFHLTTHTDPGAQFPLDYFIWILATLVNTVTPPMPFPAPAPSAPPPPPPPPSPPPSPTPTMAEVLKALAFLIFVMKVEVSQGKFYKQGDGKANGRDKGVRMIQAALVKAGQAIAVDGEFGPNTRAHVVWYQSAHKLKPDGIVGAATLAHMYP